MTTITSNYVLINTEKYLNNVKSNYGIQVHDLLISCKDQPVVNMSTVYKIADLANIDIRKVKLWINKLFRKDKRIIFKRDDSVKKEIFLSKFKLKHGDLVYKLVSEYQTDPTYNLSNIAEIANVSRERASQWIRYLYGTTVKEKLTQQCSCSIVHRKEIKINSKDKTKFPHVIDLLHKNNIIFTKFNYEDYIRRFGRLKKINDTFTPSLVDIYISSNDKIFAIRKIRRYIMKTNKLTNKKYYSYSYNMRSDLKVDYILGVLQDKDTILDNENIYIFPSVINNNSEDSNSIPYTTTSIMYVSQYVLTDKYKNKFSYLMS